MCPTEAGARTYTRSSAVYVVETHVCVSDLPSVLPAGRVQLQPPFDAITTMLFWFFMGGVAVVCFWTSALCGGGVVVDWPDPDLSRLHFSHELPLASCTSAHPAIGIVFPTTAAGPSASAGPAGPIVMAEGQAMSQMNMFLNAHASPRANSRGIFTSSSSSSSSGGHRLQL
jgi:hypothetical protein